MPPLAVRFAQSPELNTTVMVRYLWCGAVLALVALVYALFNLPSRYLYLAVAAPVVLFIITHPRLALYQYLLALFVEIVILPDVPLMLIDFSAVLAITAAILDLLLGDRSSQRVPALVGNYASIVTGLVVCGLLGFWPHLAIRPVVRLLFLTVTLAALVRLMAGTSIIRLIKWFFGLAVVHSLFIVSQFLLVGGKHRIFGLTGLHFDDVAMVALPVGIALYLWSSEKRAPWELVGSLAILVGLVATQSRAPILMSIVGCLVVALVSLWRAGRLAGVGSQRRAIRGRMFTLSISTIALVTLAVVLKPDLLAVVLERFERLFSWQPGGSVLYRVMLMKRALTAFLDHPIFGVGPGGFKHLHDLYSSLHLSTAFVETRGLSAHNLLFHYLAETGLVGGLALVALAANQLRLSWAGWRNSTGEARCTAAALFAWAFLFALSTFVEAAWMWGQLSFLAVFFAALIARQHRELRRIKG